MTEPGPPPPYDPPPGSKPVGQPYGSSPFPGQEQQYGAQPYGGQPYGGQPYGAPPAGPKRNGLGTAALVLGVLAVLSCWTVVFGFVLGLAAIVLGVVGRKRAKRGEADNGGIATAGLVLGLVGLVLSVVIGVLAGSALSRIFNSPEGQRLTECLEQAGGDRARAQVCQDEFLRSQQR